MLIPFKIFIKLIKTYIEWIITKYFQSKIKIKNKDKRFKNYLRFNLKLFALNRGKCINALDLLNQPCNL